MLSCVMSHAAGAQDCRFGKEDCEESARAAAADGHDHHPRAQSRVRCCCLWLLLCPVLVALVLLLCCLGGTEASSTTRLGLQEDCEACSIGIQVQGL